MLKLTRTYTDFDGKQRTEDLYFNFTKAELVEMRFSVNGGMEKQLQQMLNNQDGNEIVQTIKRFILDSYGEKSLDGKLFVKTPEIRAAFEQTQVFSDLFVELLTDNNKAANFINGLIPDDLKTAYAEEISKKNLMEQANATNS